MLKFAFLAASVGEILLFPVLEFSDQLDGVVAGFGYFFEALFERKIAVDGPQHDGERERDAVGFETAGAASVRATADGPAAAPVEPRPAHAPTNSRRRSSFSQEFPADIFQDVSRAFDTHFSGKDRVFIFDAEDAFEADVHVGLDDGLPEAGAVAVADGAEGFGGRSRDPWFRKRNSERRIC